MNTILNLPTIAWLGIIAFDCFILVAMTAAVAGGIYFLAKSK